MNLIKLLQQLRVRLFWEVLPELFANLAHLDTHSGPCLYIQKQFRCSIRWWWARCLWRRGRALLGYKRDMYMSSRSPRSCWHPPFRRSVWPHIALPAPPVWGTLSYPASINANWSPHTCLSPAPWTPSSSPLVLSALHEVYDKYILHIWFFLFY
jgi:hypothetical protein